MRASTLIGRCEVLAAHDKHAWDLLVRDVRAYIEAQHPNHLGNLSDALGANGHTDFEVLNARLHGFLETLVIVEGEE